MEEQPSTADQQPQDNQPEQQDAPNLSPATEGEKRSLDSLAEALKSAAGMVSPEEEAKKKLEALEDEKAQLHDKIMRAAAEVENTRRRAERDRQDAVKFAVTNFARDLVSVYENLSRASQSITDEARQADSGLNNLATGVEMTLKELQQAFTRQHIARIDPTGQPFDPNYHQAMSRIETNEHPEGTVIQMLQAAYTIHDRLLQPAMVMVAKQPSDDTNSADTTPDANHVDTKA